jgi:hypothetical protein
LVRFVEIGEVRMGEVGMGVFKRTHEEPASVYEDDKRATITTLFWWFLRSMNADLAQEAIAHGDLEDLFVTAWGDCFGCAGLLGDEALLADGVDEG